MDFKSNQEEQKMDEEEEKPKLKRKLTAEIKIGDKIVEEKEFFLHES